MKVEYKRTARGSFMVLEGHELPVGFEKQMLKENDIVRLLRFHSLELNGRTQFWYEIGGMRSFRDILMCDGITGDKLYELFSAVKESYQQLSKYLIDEEHILLHPDTLFFEKRGEALLAMLCFCPIEHEDVKAQLAELMRFVISEVDHSKTRDTALCYELYSITEREEFSFYDLEERLSGEYGENADHENDASDDMAFFASAISGQEHTDVTAEPVAVYGESFSEDGFMEEGPVKTGMHKEKNAIIPTLLGRLKDGVLELLPDFICGRRKLLPEKRPFKDIEFDEMPFHEEETVLLSEDKNYCSGKLIYESGGRGGCDLVVDKNPFSIGSRSGGNDAILSSEAVSRYHAKIYRKDGGFFIVDLNSKNGTFVNGEILPYHKPQRLNRMDMISFADVVYRMV